MWCNDVEGNEGRKCGGCSGSWVSNGTDAAFEAVLGDPSACTSIVFTSVFMWVRFIIHRATTWRLLFPVYALGI